MLTGLTIGSIDQKLAIFSFSLDFRAKFSLSCLALFTLIFGFLNVSILKGSFRCVFYMKIYILLFISFALFDVFMFNPLVETSKAILYFSHISFGLLAFYFISSKSYKKMVQIRYDNIAFFKNMHDETELKKYKSKNQKVSKKNKKVRTKK